MQSFLPKALLFKEWKQHKWWMIIGGILLLGNPVMNLIRIPASSSLVSGRELYVFWKVVVPALYGMTISSGTNGYPSLYRLPSYPSISGAQGIIAMSILIALVTVERNRGGIWYTLAGPVPRSALLRVKVILALAVVVFAWVFKFFLLLALVRYSGQRIPLSTLVGWTTSNLIFSLALMAVGLACAAVMMVGFPAGITAVLIALIPMALGRAVLPAGSSVGSFSVTSPQAVPGVPANLANASISGAMNAPAQPVLAGAIAHSLRAIAPWDYVSSSTGMSQTGTTVTLFTNSHPIGWMAIWFVLWVLMWGFVAWRAYLNAPLENSDQFFLYPQLWPVAMWFLAGLVSYVGVSAAVAKISLQPAPYAILVRLLVVWVLLGLVSQAVLRWWVRRDGGLSLKR